MQKVPSKEEARQIGHNFIDTDHLLLGLIQEGDNLASVVLEKLEVDLLEIRAQIIQNIASDTYIAAGTPINEINFDNYRDNCSDNAVRALKSAKTPSLKWSSKEGFIRQKDGFISTEEILLELLLEERIASIVFACSDINLNLEDIKTEAEKITNPRLSLIEEEGDFTPRTKRALVYAQEEFDRLGQRYIDTTHLLLGLIREPENSACTILGNLNVDISQLRTQLKCVIDTEQHEVGGVIAIQILTNLGVELSAVRSQVLQRLIFLTNLATDEEGMAIQVLTNLGVELSAVRTQVLQRLSVLQKPSQTETSRSFNSFSNFSLGRCTQGVIQAVRFAQEEARQLKHNFVGTEKLLLGLIVEGTGLAATVLKSQGVTLENARIEVKKIVGNVTDSIEGEKDVQLSKMKSVFPSGVPLFRAPKIEELGEVGHGTVEYETVKQGIVEHKVVEIPFTPRAEKVLELANSAAFQLSLDYIDTEHLLLALIQDSESIAFRVLKNLGVDISKVHSQLPEALTNSETANDSEALEPLKELYQTNQVNPNFYSQLASRGHIYQMRGRYEEALKDLNRAIELNPNYDFAFASRGDTYRMMGCYQEALKDFNRAIELNPNFDRVIANRGDTYCLMGRYQEALKDFNRAIELNPSYDFAFANRGDTYRLMGRYQEALKDLNHAIELNPNLDWAIACRGNTYQMMGRYQEALEDFNRAIELNPNFDRAIACRGGTYRMMGRYQEALKDLNRAIELNHYDWKFAIRGNTYCMMGHYQEALEDFNRAIELNPNLDYAFYWRALVYKILELAQAQADFATAIQLASENYEKNPKNWANNLNLALYLMANGNTERAKSLYLEALKEAPNYEIEIAIRDLNNFLKMFPDSHEAESMRNLLYT